MAVFSGLLVVMLVMCALLVLHSMRKYSSRRSESERRAAEAFAEMQRLTKVLRERSGGSGPVDAHLTPGERLQRRYPGVRNTAGQDRTPATEGGDA